MTDKEIEAKLRKSGEAFRTFFAVIALLSIVFFGVIIWAIIKLVEHFL